jgi:hypothetical protein
MVAPVDLLRFKNAVDRFDAANAADPRREKAGGVEYPRELLYAQRLTDWVMRLQPEASEPLRLAARSQHLCRWEVPRESYPAGRAGYLRWRRDLQQLHARKSAEILTEVGYDPETIARVQALNLKRDLGRDPECQVLEDALCLVFLQFQFSELASRTDGATMINALAKTWSKMSEQARAEALILEFGPRERELLERALPKDRT